MRASGRRYAASNNRPIDWKNSRLGSLPARVFLAGAAYRSPIFSWHAWHIALLRVVSENGKHVRIRAEDRTPVQEHRCGGDPRSRSLRGAVGRGTQRHPAGPRTRRAAENGSSITTPANKKRAGIGQPFMWDVVGLERVLESDLNQAGHTHLNTAGTINNVGLVEQVFARDKG